LNHIDNKETTDNSPFS